MIFPFRLRYFAIYPQCNAKEGTIIIKHVCLYLTMQKRGQLLNTCAYI